jgi:TPR repeat protein
VIRKRRQPNPVIALATASALVLAGCSVNIEQTDLSSVTVANDRTEIEKALGRPDEVVEVLGVTVASYTYDTGIYEPAPGGRGGGFVGGSDTYANLVGLLLLAIVVPIDYAIRSSKAKAEQEGQLASIFDADNKLLFAGKFSHPGSEIRNLEVLAATYKASESDDAGALKSLRAIALIPEQKNRLQQRWYEARKREANAGDADAQHEIAKFGSDDSEKIRWLRKAAAQDHIGAQTDLGTILLYGPNELVDRTEAKAWLTKAAEAGDINAQTELAKLVAFETALAGSEKGEVAAQFALGNAYASGKGTRKDQTRAVNWWHKAAENGYAPAQAKLARIYLTGDGVLTDFAEAEEWTRKAAETDELETVIKLARMYRYDPGPESKMREAVNLFKRAAAMGDRSALYELGVLNENGEGVQRSDVQAYMWYELAASENDQTAASARDSVAKRLTTDEIAKAERLAREWLEARPQRAESVTDSAHKNIQGPKISASRSDMSSIEVSKGNIEQENSQLLSDWRQRPDILRKAIAKESEILSVGIWRISTFEIESAAIDDRGDGLIRLETRYAIIKGAGPAGMTEPPVIYLQHVYIDPVKDAVVEVGEATPVN